MVIQDQIVVLRDTKDGMQVDTINSRNDTLFIDLNGKSIIEIPDKRLEVNTYPPSKSYLEVGALWAAILGAGLAFMQLFRRTKKAAVQIKDLGEVANALRAQNEIMDKSNSNLVEIITALTKSIGFKKEHDEELKRIELRKYQIMVMPNLKVGGQGTRGHGHFEFQIINYGESCTIDEMKVIEGSEKIHLFIPSSLTIDKNQKRKITGTSVGRANKYVFKILVSYHDQGKFKYESTITWNHSNLTIETKEIPSPETLL